MLNFWVVPFLAAMLGLAYGVGVSLAAYHAGMLVGIFGHRLPLRDGIRLVLELALIVGAPGILALTEGWTTAGIASIVAALLTMIIAVVSLSLPTSVDAITVGGASVDGTVTGKLDGRHAATLRAYIARANVLIAEARQRQAVYAMQAACYRVEGYRPDDWTPQIDWLDQARRWLYRYDRVEEEKVRRVREG